MAEFDDKRLIALGAELDKTHLAREIWEIERGTDDTHLYDRLWSLQESINEMDVRTPAGLRVKARAAFLASYCDPEGDNTCLGSFQRLSLTLIEDVKRLIPTDARRDVSDSGS